MKTQTISYIRRTAGWMLGISLLAAAAGSARATIIANGDFSANAAAYTAKLGESGVGNNYWWVTPANTYYNPSAPTGWTTANTSLQGSAAITAQSSGVEGTISGIQSLGPITSTMPAYAFVRGMDGVIYQPITLAAGHAYKLSFDYAGWQYHGGSLDVTIKDSAQTYFDSGVVASPGNVWYSTNFVFSAAATINGPITIQVNGVGSYYSLAADITNISMIEVAPEPSCLLLMGAGGLLLFRRRR